MSPTVGIKCQHEHAWVWMKRKRARNPYSKEKKNVWAFERWSVYKGERELTINTKLRLKTKTKIKDVTSKIGKKGDVVNANEERKGKQNNSARGKGISDESGEERA